MAANKHISPHYGDAVVENVAEEHRGRAVNIRKIAGFDIDLNEAPDSARVSVTIADIEEHFSCLLPESYKRFMAASDGCSGFAGTQYVALWRLSEIVQFNEEYELDADGPVFVAFGSNGGGEGFAFLRDESMRIVMIPFMDPRRKNAVAVSNTFDDFFSNLSAGIHFE